MSHGQVPWTAHGCIVATRNDGHSPMIAAGEMLPARYLILMGRTGAENCSVRSRSVMSTTVSIGAISS